jgi:Holliday junction resolvase RusA-like endonuclease
MIVRSFIVPGKPYAKKRHRIGTIGGKGRAFNPKENVTAEGAIGNIAARHFAAPIMGAVKVEVIAYFAIPKSWSKKKAAAHLGQPHCQKPDGDNILKAVKDALNRIAWADDGQVYDARVRKVWGWIDQTVIHVEGAESKELEGMK